MYDFRQTAGVLRSSAATLLMASRMQAGDRPLGRGVGQRRRVHDRCSPQRCAPGAEVLRREIGTHGLPEVRVDVARFDRSQLAAVVDILEQALPRQLMALPNESARDACRRRRSRDRRRPCRGTGRRALRRRRTGRAGCAASSDRSSRCRAHIRRSRCAFVWHRGGSPRRPAPFRAAGPGSARSRRSRRRSRGSASAKSGIRSNFLPSRKSAPLRVVAILLAATRVAARRLNVAARIRADPDVLVRGRNREARDALEFSGLGQRSTIGEHVVEIVRRGEYDGFPASHPTRGRDPPRHLPAA